MSILNTYDRKKHSGGFILIVLGAVLFLASVFILMLFGGGKVGPIGVVELWLLGFLCLLIGAVWEFISKRVGRLSSSDDAHSADDDADR